MTTPPITAPGAKVAHAASVVQRRVASPASPTVSTIENPHGDHAPVSPTSSAAATRLSSRALIGAPSEDPPPDPSAQHGTWVW